VSVIEITAQVSLYPLPQEAVAPELGEALEVLQGCALEVKPDAVSRVLVGDDDAIFPALQQALCHAAEQGKVVMVVTLSNACPAPGRPGETVLES
jgi:hypothetical protein